MKNMEEKIKSLNGTEFRGFYFVFTVVESGAMYMNKFDLKKQEWGEWTKTPTPVPNTPPIKE